MTLSSEGNQKELPLSLGGDPIPLYLLLLFFGTSFLLYSFLSFFYPNWIPRETTPKRSSFFPPYLQNYILFLFYPLLKILLLSRFPPNGITTISLFLTFPASYAILQGELEWGGFFYTIAGIADWMDGKVARMSGKVTPFGGVLDSTIDRINDGLVHGALLWHFRFSPLFFSLLFFSLLGGFLTSYVRARSEGEGKPVRSGFLQRQERVFLLLSSLLLSRPVGSLFPGEGIVSGPDLLFFVVLGSAFFSFLTAISRLLKVRKESG